MNFRFELKPGDIGRLTGRLPRLLDEGKSAGIILSVHAANGELAGTFSGKITGTFRVTPREALIEVTKKPFLATEGMIRSRLAALFAS